jgi:hypothetical protein
MRVPVRLLTFAPVAALAVAALALPSAAGPDKIKVPPAGTYEYICGLHPSMKGTVEVR